MSDILIVGGGIIGMLTARELSLAGMQVTIVEQGEAGHESSWAGGGIVSPLYPWRYPAAVSALAKWGQAFYPELIAEVMDATGLDAELIQSGLLMLEDEPEQALEWAEKWSSNLQLIDKKDVYEIEPELDQACIGHKKAIWMPDIRQVRNPRLVKAMKQYLLKTGVHFLEQTEVMGFTQTANKVTGIKTNKGELNADKVLIASGAWSANLLKNIKINIDVAPVKGQMILFKSEPNKIKRIVLSRDRYVIPRKDGRVLVGSTLEHTQFEKVTTLAAKNELMEEAYRLTPCLKEADLEHHWAGLRPGSSTGIPYICAVPDVEGLYLNTGHYRNGIVLGAASARLAADIILNRENTLNSSPYVLHRG